MRRQDVSQDIPLLRSGTDDERVAAAKSLVKRQDSRKDSRKDAQQVAEQDAQLVMALLNALQYDAPPAVRAASARALGRQQVGSAVSPLIRALTSETIARV